MLHKEQLKERLDESCNCSAGYPERHESSCDLCFLSEVKENFYCPEHQVESHGGHYYDDESSEEIYRDETESHDCRGCACGILRDFSENTPVEISTSKVKNVRLYFKYLDPDRSRVSFWDPSSERSVSTDCRNITSIRYMKDE